LGLFRRRNLAAQDLLTGSIQEHREVLAAIRSRNAALAADTLRRHVLQSRERTARSQDAADAPAKASN
jgi:DNA-binding GntR family transcriptional regulator